MGSQVHEVVRSLEQSIVEGRYLPGSRLPPERALAASLKVSRSTIREAITLLGTRGMLVRRQGDGTYVTAPEERHAAEIWGDMARENPMLQADLVEFRAMLESRAAELAALRHDAADRARLEQAHLAVDAAYAGSDRRVQIQADVAFHRAIADATHNKVFSYLSTSLLTLLHDHVQLSLAGLPPRSHISQQLRRQHDDLLHAILSRDAQRAGKVAGDHIDFVAVQLNALPRVLHADAPQPPSS